MSNVVSPRGPLPPKVYWRRRLLMLAVVVGVVVLVGQLLGGDDGTEPVAERAAPTPTAKADEAAPAPRERAREGDHAARGRATNGPRPASGPGSLSGAVGPLAPPAGACAPADVLIAPDVEDTDAAGPVPLRLGLSATGDEPCTFEFGPDSVALQITSGDDLIWQSLKCPSALEEQSVVVRPGWLSYVTVEWSGRRGTESCGDANDFADPGYYWAEAAAVGGEPERSQFELETPPKPEPTKKPSKKTTKKPTDEESAKPSDRPSDERSDRPSDQAEDDTDTAGESPEPSQAERSAASQRTGRDGDQRPDDGRPAGDGARDRDAE